MQMSAKGRCSGFEQGNSQPIVPMVFPLGGTGRESDRIGSQESVERAPMGSVQKKEERL